MFRYDDPDKMLKVNDVAAILNVHPNTIRHWSEQGRIAVCRIGSRGDRRSGRVTSLDLLTNPIHSSKRMGGINSVKENAPNATVEDKIA